MHASVYQLIGNRMCDTLIGSLCTCMRKRETTEKKEVASSISAHVSSGLI